MDNDLAEQLFAESAKVIAFVETLACQFETLAADIEKNGLTRQGQTRLAAIFREQAQDFLRETERQAKAAQKIKAQIGLLSVLPVSQAQ